MPGCECDYWGTTPRRSRVTPAGRGGFWHGAATWHCEPGHTPSVAGRKSAQVPERPLQQRRLQRLDQAFAAHDLLELRSEEHTSELQSRENLVCRLLLEKK